MIHIFIIAGPDGPQKVQPITDKVADLQMFIERADQELSSLSHSLKQIEEPMDTSGSITEQPAVVAAHAPPVLPKPSSPPKQPSVEALISQQAVSPQRKMPREQQVMPVGNLAKSPLPGAVQVLPMAGETASYPHRVSPPAMPKPSTSGPPTRPPTFLTHLKGAEINEGERSG